MDSEVVDNPAQSRLELTVDDATAAAYCRIEYGRFVLIHTEVPQELSGHGIGSRLAHGVFEAIRGSGPRLITECPFMAAHAGHHPEYATLLDG